MDYLEIEIMMKQFLLFLYEFINEHSTCKTFITVVLKHKMHIENLYITNK